MSGKEVQNGSENKPVATAGDGAKEGPQRAAWGGQLEFLLTCVGYAVGLGNVWRFPYMVYRNGGGAFIIPYVIMLVTVGLPIFFFELSFGQFASLGPIAIWTVNPLFKGVGIGMVAVSWLISLSYNVIISWCLYYLFASMTNDLPWADCDNPWNTASCILGKDLKVLTSNETLLNITLAERNLTTVEDFRSPSDQFYFTEVLRISPDIDSGSGIVWQLAICLFLAWFIVFLVLIKGISSLGKVVYFVTIFPYLMMTAMLVRGATLPGAGEGVRFYMEPDWSRLQDGAVWSDAATQIFYSLSACSGGLIVMASFNRFKNNCLRDSLIVPFVNCLTSLFAGFAIFSVLGFMADEKGVDVSKVAQAGPGLVFVVYPEGLTQMPGPTVWSILFFIMMTTLGFSSQFSIVEAVFASIMDEFPQIFQRYKYAPVIFRGCGCLFNFLITLPMVTPSGLYLFQLVDSYTSGFPLLFIGLFELIAVQWVYGCRRFLDDVLMMLTGKRPRDIMFFVVCWVGLTPLILLFIIIFKAVVYTDPTLDGYEYPPWAHAVGWLIVTFTLMWIPIVMIVRVAMDRSCKKAAAPTSKWGPALEENRTGRYATVGPLQAFVGGGQVAPEVPPPYTEAVGHDNNGYESQELSTFKRNSNTQDQVERF